MLSTVATPRHRRRWGVSVALLAALVVPALPSSVPAQAAPPAPAEEIADKRAQAERIERELEAQGRRVSLLAEDLNESRLEADRIAGEVAATEAALRQTQEQMEAARSRLRLRAVTAYMRGGTVPAVELVATGPATDLGKRRAYVGVLVGQDRSAVDDLETAKEVRRARQAELEVAQRSARAAVQQVEARRKQAAEAAAARRETLDQVKGELAELVAAEARRRAEEEARRARALLASRQAAARRAEEAAARRAQAAREEAARRGAGSPATAPRLPSAPGSAPPAGAAAGAEAAVAEAKRQLGKPYEYGASGPASFDCSGLTSWAWRAGGRTLSHSSRAQYAETARVPVEQIQLGDLIFYGSPIHHVGIYVGDGRMVEASETGTPVRYAGIYRSDLVGVGRVR